MAQWIRYIDADGQAGFGVLEGGRVTEHRGDQFHAPQATGRVLDLADVRPVSPCSPTKIVGLWNNFHALAQKLGKPVPAHPLYFLKPATAVIGTGEPIRRPQRYAGKIVFEGELGIVIGRRCSNVSAAEADRHIFGYTCVNDVTAAELITEDENFAQWTRAKGFDTFACLGPAITTDLDWKSAHLITTLDGVERQNYPLSDMVFSPQEMVSRISGDMTLYPGDVIACGTSIGLGSMKEGATVCVVIDGVGALRNTLIPAGNGH